MRASFHGYPGQRTENTPSKASKIVVDRVKTGAKMRASSEAAETGWTERKRQQRLNGRTKKSIKK